MAYLKTSIYADWTMESTTHAVKRALNNLPIIARFSTSDNVHLDVILEGKSGILKHARYALENEFGDLDFDTW
jgi:hypothetical protein